MQVAAFHLSHGRAWDRQGCCAPLALGGAVLFLCLELRAARWGTLDRLVATVKLHISPQAFGPLRAARPARGLAQAL